MHQNKGCLFNLFLIFFHRVKKKKKRWFNCHLGHSEVLLAVFKVQHFIFWFINCPNTSSPPCNPWFENEERADH